MTIPRVLFVCTGNICRSAYAEVAARSVFTDGTYHFSSAGTQAVGRPEATPEMQKVAAEHGLDLSSHRATPLASSPEPDLVFGMELHHLIAARTQFPDLSVDRIRLLREPHSIKDPYGMGLDVYRETSDHIDAALRTMEPSNFL